LFLIHKSIFGLNLAFELNSLPKLLTFWPDKSQLSLFNRAIHTIFVDNKDYRDLKSLLAFNWKLDLVRVWMEILLLQIFIIKFK